RNRTRFPHFVRLHAFGVHYNVNYLVMDLCGPNLMELKKSTREDRMTAGTSLRLAIQMTRSLQHMHSTGWLHRDVKPSNFCIGYEPSTCRTVFLIDFGLCRPYREIGGEHRNPRPRVGFRGTVRYASVNIHSNRDM